jgi:hypothetical protein
MRKVFRTLGITLGAVLPLVVAAGVSTPSAGATSYIRCEPVIDQTFPYPTFPCPTPNDPLVPPLIPYGNDTVSVPTAQPSGATTLGIVATGAD